MKRPHVNICRCCTCLEELKADELFNTQSRSVLLDQSAQGECAKQLLGILQCTYVGVAAGRTHHGHARTNSCRPRCILDRGCQLDMQTLSASAARLLHLNFLLAAFFHHHTNTSDAASTSIITP